MTKLIALMAAGILATGTAFAGNAGCCTKQVENSGKMACEASTADLNLTAEQKKKMEVVMSEHHKAGCSAASEAKYMQEAKGILNKEQYAKFEAECKGMKEKTKA